MLCELEIQRCDRDVGYIKFGSMDAKLLEIDE